MQDIIQVTHFSNSKSTKWQEQQISANPASTLGPSSTMMMTMELSNICFVIVFECGRPGLQSSTLQLSVHPSRGGRPWIQLSENDKGSFSLKGDIFGWKKKISDFKFLTLELLKLHHQSLKLKFLKYAAQVTTDLEPVSAQNLCPKINVTFVMVV